ncbi:1-deoxy-D-xylulose-5-phosphate synthase [Geopsychrobacter electrodiphilus]|uniref:1-deoxy-D-xylulose-5-phosphate synthase n=1 Tax=Geopsychrobacter electrodiphilus TaxID=225196 RepID=UPI0003605E6C|nr:1-deoxy-D-xylulose-5-phosphate synthase [Geopsychrobacter electrodiphilus]
MHELLTNLTCPADLKKMDLAQLEQLAAELRETIISTVASCGGHLGSSLGVVELTIAIHKVFDSPRDRIVWDVGHQAYVHKLLTGRLENFGSLRQLDGLSGFPKRKESEHDAFDVGHSSTSISAALGMSAGIDIMGGDERVIAVIGDGSLTAGMAFEALNHAGSLKKKLIVILNDNEMSISPNVGALSSFLSRKMSSELFLRFKKETENILNHVPGFGKDLVNLARRAEESLKGFITPGMLFEAFGFDYFGLLDGHNLPEMIATLKNVRNIRGPVLLHVATRKGKGYLPAEKEPAKFHGVGPFDRETGQLVPGKPGAVSYTSVFGKTLSEMAEKDERIVAITAAMPAGTGLSGFAEAFPKRFFDVGIAEQHAVTFAAGLACRGLRPVVALYSTFLQRAYDNVLHDVCLQNLPVSFALDRGGLVGADGPTHHGVFDLSFLRHIPNLVLMAPRNEFELKRAMLTAIEFDGPFAYRYPRGNGEGLSLAQSVEPIPIGKGEILREGKEVAIIAVGSMVGEALKAAEILSRQGVDLLVADARYIKPLDGEMILDIANRVSVLLTAEENALQGGFGSAVLELLSDHGVCQPVIRVGIADHFVEQGTQAELRERVGIDAVSICERINEALTQKAKSVQI